MIDRDFSCHKSLFRLGLQSAEHESIDLDWNFGVGSWIISRFEWFAIRKPSPKFRSGRFIHLIWDLAGIANLFSFFLFLLNSKKSQVMLKL